MSITTKGRPSDSRLPLPSNPVRLLFSPSPWRAAGYLLTYLIVSGVLFAIVVTASVATAALAVTIALAPLLIASAAMIRGCAQVERGMLRQVFRQPVSGSYPPPPPAAGLWRRGRASWTSGATWRDVACLAGLWVPLLTLATVVFAIWVFFLAGITLPLWYRRVADVCVGLCGGEHVRGVLIGSYPNGPRGAGADGLWLYHSIGPTLLIAGGCAVAFLLFNYVLVLTARAHGQIARAVLRPHPDPLGPARDVLAGPGPLGPVSPADG